MKKRCLARNAAALVLAISLMTACSSSVKETAVSGRFPDYTEVTAVESLVSGYSDAYSVEDGNLYKIGSKIDYVTEMQRSSKGDVVAQLVRTSKGQNLDGNVIRIYRNGKMMTLDSFFSASDIKMNGAGTKLAYRSYSEDSLDSVQKLKIFDLETKEWSEIKSGVRVSGSVYCWLDDDNLLYYGSDPEAGGTAKIYKYNTATGKQDVYLDNLKGFCMKIIPAEGGIAYFETNGTESNICFFDSGKESTITSDVADLYDAVYSPEAKAIYLSGIMAGDTEEALYMVDLAGAAGLKRICYDFPKLVGSDSTLSLDKEGRLYFTGILEGKAAGELDVFSYDSGSRTVSLLSSESGYYRLY
jgi:hypothetical protein